MPAGERVNPDLLVGETIEIKIEYVTTPRLIGSVHFYQDCYSFSLEFPDQPYQGKNSLVPYHLWKTM